LAETSSCFSTMPILHIRHGKAWRLYTTVSVKRNISLWQPTFLHRIVSSDATWEANVTWPARITLFSWSSPCLKKLN
jgi:hypothetical protein